MITPDDDGVAQMLQKEFVNRGINAEISDSPNQHARGLILLDALKVSQTLKAPLDLTNYYLSLFEKIQKVSKTFSDHGGFLITVQDTGGQFGLNSTLNNEEKALTAGLTGIVKTAALEWPKARCRSLDMTIKNQSPELIAKKLFDEIQDLVSNDYKLDELEFGIPNFEKNERIKLKVAPEKIQLQYKKTLLKKSVLVVTGGARGITAASLIALSKKQPLKLALLGRSELAPEPIYCHGLQDKDSIKKAIIKEAKHLKSPKQIEQHLNQIMAHREIFQTISTLEGLGSEVMYFSVDVTDETSLKIAFDKIRKQFGHIDGIIHGAGVLADKLITEKTKDQFKQVFDTKITGLLNLIKETQYDALKYFILFSSVAGRYGNIGQSDYACANEVLNKLAQFMKQQRKDCIVKSINWAPWDSGMVDEQLKKMFEKRNIPILSLKRGSEIFVEEMLFEDPGNAEIIYGGLFEEIPNDVIKEGEVEKKEMYLNAFSKVIQVNVKTDDYILDHQIKNVAVMPACLVLDWFLRLLRENRKADNPNEILEIRHFKVLKGIKLNNFLSGENFSFEIQQPHAFGLKLVDDHKLSRYSAEFEFKNLETPLSSPVQSHINKKHWPFEISEIYQTENPNAPLFNGKHFQGIKTLCDYSTEGGSAILSPMKKMKQLKNVSWPDQPWQIDMVVFDSVLQLLLLWTHSMLGKGSLPTQIDKIIFYQKTLPEDSVHCLFKSRVIDKLKTRSDIQLFDQNEKLIASLSGVEMCVVYSI